MGVNQWMVSLLLVTCFLVPGGAARADASSFRDWIEGFRREAESAGISRDTYQAAFSGITEHDARVLEKANYQPEFTQEIWDYLDTRVNALSVERGLAMKTRYGQLLERIEAEFGVGAPVVLAIWSMESNYGAVLEKTERLHYVPQALATLGWGDPKRRKFGRTQLLASLEILQSGDIGRDKLLGSWAGAMGHTQFIPTSYLAYGVDFDGDGRRDIWNSVADALATAANLLASNGWRTGKTWGYEVALPAGSGQYEGQTKTLGEWAKLGFVRPGGRAFPFGEEKAELKIPAGDRGPGFLMLRNFFVVKKYNNSDFYALGVGLLADRLSGWDGLVQEWPRPADALSFDEKCELQRLLKERGFYEGEVDGHPGQVTRQAIRAFQKETGVSVDGSPGREVLQLLRR